MANRKKKPQATKSYLVSIRTQGTWKLQPHKALHAALADRTKGISNEQREHTSAWGLSKEPKLLIVPLKAMLIAVLKNMRSSGYRVFIDTLCYNSGAWGTQSYYLRVLVFLPVRKLGDQFIPYNLFHMKRFFKKAPSALHPMCLQITRNMIAKQKCFS